MASSTPIPLAAVTFQYWFNGPDGVPSFETGAPNSLFNLTCSDTTTGASSIAVGHGMQGGPCRGQVCILESNGAAGRCLLIPGLQCLLRIR